METKEERAARFEALWEASAEPKDNPFQRSRLRKKIGRVINNEVGVDTLILREINNEIQK